MHLLSLPFRPGRTFLEVRRSIDRLLLSFLLLGTLTSWAQSASQAEALVRSGQGALQAGDGARAAADFEKARQMAPGNLEANRGLLLTYLEAGRLRDAEAVGTDAAARWPQDAQIQHWLGLVYFKSGRNQQALAALERSGKLDGEHFDIHFDTSLVLLEMKQYPAAAEELEGAIRLKPSDAIAHVLLGRAYQNSNRTVQAIEQFQSALRLDPNVPLGYYHLGFAYASVGRNVEAIAEYEKEVVRSADNPNVRYELGHCLLETGDWKTAILHLKKASELNPQSADAAYDLGKALLLEGDATGAMAALRRSIALNPNDPSPHYQLARALEKTGNPDEAKLERKRFAELKKTQPKTGGMATGRIQ